jgi:arylsulfatase
VRTQWHHVIDIAPTILEAASLPQPKLVNGTLQTPIEGVSLAYTFDDAKAADRHETQYFEIFANRAIYHEGWLAGTVHRAPWEMKPRTTLQNDVWELYDTRSDFSLVNDLAAKEPARLQELQTLFMSEAAKNHALPLDDRGLERTNAELAGRPDLMAGRTSLTVFEGMTGLTENVFLNLKNHSHTITAELEVPEQGGEGVILCQAGRFGGWSLYLKAGKPTYTYNFLGLERYSVAAPDPLPAGKATIQFTFASDGGKPGAGGMGAIAVGGKKVAEGRIDRTQGYAFSADEGADVGVDEGTPVTEDYKEGDNRFTGKIQKVTVEIN